MKKIILVVFTLLAFISFSIASNTVSYGYISDILYAPSYINKTTRFSIKYNDKIKDVEVFKKIVLEVANKYNVSVMKYEKNLNSDIYSIFLYTKDEAIFEDCGLILSPNEINDFNENLNKKISNNTTLKNAILFPKFPTTTVITYSNYKSSDNTNVDGEYLVIGENSKLFLQDMRKYYKDVNFDEVNGIENANLNTDSLFDSSVMKIFMEYMFLLGITTIVCLLIHFHKQEKKLAIKKLYGWSNIKLLYKENRILLLEILLINLSVYMFLACIEIGSIHKYTVMLFKYLLIFISLEIAMLILIYAFLFIYYKHISYTLLLKNKNYNKSSFMLNFILRLAILIYSVSLLSQQAPSLLNNISMSVKQHEFQKETAPYESIAYIAHDVKEEQSFDFSLTIYKELNKQGSLGIETMNYIQGQQQLAYLTVNPNYLDTYPILLNDGTPFKAKNNMDENDKLYLLVPETIYTEKQNEINKQFDTQLYEIIKVKDNQNVFTFDSTIHEAGLGYAHSPILVVSGFINTNSLYINEKWLNKTNLSKVLLEKKYPDAIEFRDVPSKESDKFQYAKRELLDSIKIVIVDILTLIVVIIQLILLYMQSNRKEIAIKKMNGYSLLKQYENLFMIQFSFYVLIFFYIIIKSSFYMLPTLMLILLFESLFTLSVIKLNNRKSIIQKIKED